MDPLLPQVSTALAGRYKIDRELGRGGMGAVYLAEDIALHRRVAVKVLPPELAVVPDIRERFLRETRLAAGFSHPNIVHVHSVEDHPQVLAFVMGYVEGETLAERIARTGPLAPDQVVRVMQESAWALGYAHARGIVHRDVKPDNIMVERATGRALVMDFGIARQESARGLTEVGHSIGTPQFMSPEQAAGEVVDQRSDLYSLGCTMYAAATGQPPFSGKPAQQLLMMHLTQPPPPIASIRPDFPKPIADVIERCLAKNPDDRFANAEDLAEEIESLSLRQREIAPILRLFLQQAAQGAQLTVVLLAMQPMMSRVMRQDQAIHIVFAVLSFTIIVASFGQVVTRARHLVRLGFRHDDVKGAFDTTQGELHQARDQLMADPVERRRIRNTRFFGVLAVMWGLVCFPLALRFGSVTRAAGVRSFNGIGALLLVASAVGVGLGIALGFSRPARTNVSQRLAARIWGGRIGRWIFARAERQLARSRPSA